MRRPTKAFARLAPLIAALLAPAVFGADQPHVLVIIADDLNDEVGCYGKPYIHTPNIDRLARESVRFNRAYCQYPVCAASRASFLTGLRPDTTGVEYPYSQYFVEDVLKTRGTMSNFFHENGYDTRHFGKVHHGYLEPGSKPEFHPPWRLFYNADNLETFATDGKSACPPYERSRIADADHMDGQIARAAVEAIREAAGGDAPFFFIVGLHKPHLPFAAPEAYWALYDHQEIPLAENKHGPRDGPTYAFDKYVLQQYRWEHRDPNRIFSDAYARTVRQGYFACVSFMDTQVGLLLQELDARGIRDNTIVLFMSDHGYHLGELNHWAKTTNYEEAARAPLIISQPGGKHPGDSTEALVEYVDIFPTLADLAGLPVPDHLEGTSMVPVLSNPTRSWKRAAFTQQSRGWTGNTLGRSIRTDRYRYVEWRDRVSGEVLARELYDLDRDPHEFQNLAHDALRAETLRQQAEILNAGWKAALPAGVTNRSDNPPAPPAYAYGNEGTDRREKWHEIYGGDVTNGWREATRLRTAGESRVW